MIKQILLACIGLALIAPNAEASEKKRNRQAVVIKNAYDQTKGGASKGKPVRKGASGPVFVPPVPAPGQSPSGPVFVPPVPAPGQESSLPSREQLETGRAAGDVRRQAVKLAPGEAPVPSAPPLEVEQPLPSAPPLGDLPSTAEDTAQKRGAVNLGKGSAVTTGE